MRLKACMHRPGGEFYLSSMLMFVISGVLLLGFHQPLATLGAFIAAGLLAVASAVASLAEPLNDRDSSAAE